MYTFISDILLFQCQKMGIFRVFTEILPAFSEGRGPKNFLEQKILETYLKTFLITTKHNILDIKNKFQTFLKMGIYVSNGKTLQEECFKVVLKMPLTHPIPKLFLYLQYMLSILVVVLYFIYYFQTFSSCNSLRAARLLL